MILKLNEAGQALHDGTLIAADVSWISKWDEKEYIVLPLKLNRFKIDADTNYPHIVYSTGNYKSLPNNLVDEMKLLASKKLNHWIDKISPAINQISNSVDSLGIVGTMFDSIMQQMINNINAMATQIQSSGDDLDVYDESQ